MESRCSDVPTFPIKKITSWQSSNSIAGQDSQLLSLTLIDSIGNSDSTSQLHWFAMRDLKRPNAKIMAWQDLTQKGFTVFTPKKWVTTTVQGKRIRREVPYIPDLLFVRATRAELDPEVDATPTLQYRYAIGSKATPITVRDAEMNRFVTAVSKAPDTKYYLPDELTPEMLGREILIIGGPLEGYRGTLLSLRGTRTRRMLVQLPGIITAAVEVSPEFIQLA